MSGNVKKFKKKGYESISRNMLQDVDRLSLQAIGLLSNLTSMPDNWKIYKTELYKRYAKNGRTSVQNAWNELVEHNYIVQLRRRNGKKFDYIYYHSQESFSQEDVEEIERLEGCEVWDGKKTSNVEKQHTKKSVPSNADFEHPKMDFPKSTSIKLTSKEINYEDKDLDTRDTESNDILLHSFSNSLTDEEREKQKEAYIQEAFYQNEAFVPPNIANMLKVFSKTPEQAKHYYEIILRAKKKAAKDIDAPNHLIWLEDDSVLEQKIIHTFIRSIRKIERERNIKNPDGYIFTGIYDLIINERGKSLLFGDNREEIQTLIENAEKNNVPFFNWLDEQEH